MKRQLLPILIVVGLVAALVLALILVRQNQNINKKASQPNGPATLVLTPAANPVTVGTGSQTTVSAFTAGLAIDGIQAVINISGETPPNFTFTVTPITGMQVVTNSTTNTSSGKLLNLAFITTNPLQPFVSSVPVQIGTFTYTPVISGTMNFSFDPVLSKIVQNQTTNDILNTPVSSSVSFILPSPTPTPTPTPVSLPTPTPTPVASPFSTPTPIGGTPTPTPTPLPINSCNGLCVNNSNCQTGLVCDGTSNRCRNPLCSTVSNCICSSPTPTPVASPFSTPTPIGGTPTPTPTPTPLPVPGDASGDGKVDGVDYIIWLNHYGQNSSQGRVVGDFNTDSHIDGIDYIIWLNHYGQ